MQGVAADKAKQEKDARGPETKNWPRQTRSVPEGRLRNIAGGKKAKIKEKIKKKLVASPVRLS